MEFGVPSVAYNASAVQVSGSAAASGGVGATAGASGTSPPTSDASFTMFSSAMVGLVIVGFVAGLLH